MSGFITYVAEAVPFDNADNFYDAENVKDALIETDFRELTNDPTGFENIEDSEVSFDNLTRTFTIQPKAPATAFYYRIRGKRFAVNAPASIQISDTIGLWFFYFNDSGALIASQVSPFDFQEAQAFTMALYWSTTDQEVVYFGEERHGLSMDWATHKRLHQADGAQIGRKQFKVGDFTLNGDGSLESHITLSISNGVLYDEDISNSITHSDTPDPSLGEQFLTPIAKLPMFYRSGPLGEWRRLPATDYILAQNGGGLPYWNEWTGTTWQLTPIPERNYAATLVLVTNCKKHPIMGVVPQLIGTNAVEATRDIIDIVNFSGVPFEETYPLALGVYEVSASFTNPPKARFVAITDVDGLEDQTDRYAILASYNGNANTNRYLEVVPGVASDVDPFYFPDDSFIRTVVAQAAAVDTYTIGFFRTTDLVTPVFSVAVVASRAEVFDVSALFNAGDELAIRVISGNVNTPSVRFWVQTTIGS